MDQEEDASADNNTAASEPQAEARPPEQIEVTDGTVLKLQMPRMAGPYVLKVQDALNEDGYIIDDKDGVYGSGTNLAIKAFQIQNGLTPSGELDAITAQKLGL